MAEVARVFIVAVMVMAEVARVFLEAVMVWQRMLEYSWWQWW